jgi:hypothetical protein
VLSRLPAIQQLRHARLPLGVIALLPATVAPGAALDVPFSVAVPTQPGTYTLRVDVVYEGTQWFADRRAA